MPSIRGTLTTLLIAGAGLTADARSLRATSDVVRTSFTIRVPDPMLYKQPVREVCMMITVHVCS